MSYNPDQFERVAFIVRGRGQEERDKYLPLLAAEINRLTPVVSTVFREKLSEFLCNMLGFSKYCILPKSKRKTIDNWYTETTGKILGLYYYDRGKAHISENACKLLETNDHPIFYKNICASLQVPNGINKRSTATAFVNLGINFSPCLILLKILKAIYENNDELYYLTKKEISYYILNNLCVMKNDVYNFAEIINSIKLARKNGSETKINSLILKKNSSYYTQHTNECVNLLEYANLVSVDGNRVKMNQNDIVGVDEVLGFHLEELPFQVSTKSIDYENEWLKYFGSLRKDFSPTLASTLSVKRFYEQSAPYDSNLNNKSPENNKVVKLRGWRRIH
jgi:hypothetical protein